MSDPSLNLNRDFNTFTKTFSKDIDEKCLYEKVSFSNENDGTKVEVVINKDRAQCYCCQRWFPSIAHLDHHFRWTPGGCAQCKMCFRSEDNVVHAMQHAHDRCFVETCKGKERETGGWGRATIENHVRDKHSCMETPPLPAYESVV